MRTLFLGQPILIYDPSTHENGDFDYLAVIYVGRPLDDHKHAVLLALVGYLSGGRAVSVLQEQFDSARKLRTAYLDRGQPTIRRSPPIPIDRVTPHSMLMVNEFPRLAEAFNRWKTTESRSFEAVFHHYAEGVDSNYPTTRILRLAVALEAFINLVTGDSSSNEKIIEDDGRFNVIRNHLLNDLSSYRDENTDRLTENELRRLALKITNMNSASNTRRLDKFWSAVPIEKSPDDERLLRRLRNESVHLGYVGEEGTREGLLRNAADADRLTDIFNRAVLAYAGYAGPVRSAHDGSWIEAVSGERFNPPPLPPGDSIELRMDVTVPSMSPSEAEAAERLQRISRSAQRKASE
jgi:hypothetical protein